MDPDFMRFVDKYAGIPICFVLTLISYPFRIFAGRGKMGSLKKVLFLELSEMGSSILAYSAIKKVLKENPGVKVYFLIFEKNRESVDILGVIPKDHVLTIRESSLFGLAIDTLKVIFKMRSLKLEAVLDLELFSRFTAILSYLSGAKIKVGYYKFHMEGLYRGNLINRKVSYNPYMHMSKNFVALVDSIKNDKDWPLLKKDISDSEVDRRIIKSSKEEKEKIFVKLKSLNPDISKNDKIVLINPDASELLPIRKWPIENYCKLAELILKMKDVVIVITGVRSDLASANKICDHVNNDKRCINLAGKTKSIRELIDLYNISNLLVTNDSGPGHFVSMTDIPQIIFFGPETPRLYGPLSERTIVMYSDFACSPCVSAFNHRKTSCKDNRCLKVITVEEVYNKVASNLK